MKTSRFFSIFAIALVALSTSLKANSTEQSTNDFTCIQVTNNVNLQFIDGNDSRVIANGDEVTLEYDGNTLTISTKDTSTTPTVTICAPQLRTIEYDGNADITLSGRLNANQLVMCLNGEGTMVIEDASIKRLSCSVQGSGNIFFYSLKADMMVCNLANTGKVIMGSLTSDDCLAHETALNVVSRSFDNPDSKIMQKASFVAKGVEVSI